MARLGRPPKAKRGRPLGSKNKKKFKNAKEFCDYMNEGLRLEPPNWALEKELERLKLKREIKKLKAPWYKRFFI